jgi:hypothetical protein
MEQTNPGTDEPEMPEGEQGEQERPPNGQQGAVQTPGTDPDAGASTG